MLETIKRIQARERERAYLTNVLELWAQAHAQGHSYKQVRSFGFDPALLDGKAKRLPREYWSFKRYGHDERRPRWFSFVRYQDGAIHPLNPPLKAVYREGENDDAEKTVV